jgi:hypothetical protein
MVIFIGAVAAVSSVNVIPQTDGKTALCEQIKKYPLTSEELANMKAEIKSKYGYDC